VIGRALVLVLLVGAAQASPDDALVERLTQHHAYTGGHVRRVGEYAAWLAARLGLPADQIARCRSAGRLHDLGKLDVPLAILDKPGKLAPDEWAVIRTHPARGADRAREAGVDARVVEGIRGHHERWDGHGYPAGSRGDATPQIARIVSVADTWDAVTTRRSYQPARTFDEGVKVLREAAGTQLDPTLVAAFLSDPAGLRALLAAQLGVR